MLAKHDELTVLLYFAIWLFNWDDEIDEPTGSYADDLDGAERYRSQTIDFVLKSLGLQDQVSSTSFYRAQNKIIASFKDIGEPLARAYSVEQRHRFMGELYRFMSHTKHEQDFRLRSEMPTIEEYWSFRMGTSAVGIVVAAQEYAMNIRINDTVMRTDRRINAITNETIINIVIVNDLLSLKKEISKGCIDSLVPIYCAIGMSVQEAIETSVEALAMSKARFDAAARSLRASAQREPAKYKHVSEWIDGCQTLCVGNLEWSLATGRYGVKEDRVVSDGSIRFTL
ncbi:isoprenoid synthase domain-containing protein [Phaeosphaeria sp. MPI-PUGE-AT-0046c]|nr:isoprenoid synthase domain-containing protein [Phaeosphaeria sp. MPI-PUGE-AT-0046c]